MPKNIFPSLVSTAGLVWSRTERKHGGSRPEVKASVWEQESGNIPVSISKLQVWQNHSIFFKISTASAASWESCWVSCVLISLPTQINLRPVCRALVHGYIWPNTRLQELHQRVNKVHAMYVCIQSPCRWVKCELWEYLNSNQQYDGLSHYTEQMNRALDCFFFISSCKCIERVRRQHLNVVIIRAVALWRSPHKTIPNTEG